MDVVLGIDTSCYTTSVAVADIESEKCVKYELLLLLPDKGEKGLRQSTALFFHIKNIPELMDKLVSGENFNIKAVAVSAKPRPLEGSYMPVFEAGVCAARSVAASLGVPCFKTTHQENHIMAASEGKISDDFYALHLSGGTTEFLSVASSGTGFNIKLVSATTDISFGKLIDRIGVMMGLEFPCGRSLEELAEKGKPVFSVETKLYNGNISLSGAEKKFTDVLGQYSCEDIAASLFDYCGKLLAKWVAHHIGNTYGKTVLFAGGVSSNKIIKKIILSYDKLNKYKTECIFAEPDLCKDNAVGVSMIGAKMFNLQRRAE